ncbi:DUF2007 domain-containing protein [Dokdonia sinensis]|nr:DUF2007 domain-containing protein [Dokdonia sinensis]
MDHRKIYTGSKINAQYLQSLLLESSLKSVIRDDGESSRRAGFGVDYMNEAKLLIHKDDYLKAKHILDNAMDDDGNLMGIDEELLEEQAMQTRSIPVENAAQQSTIGKRSPFNLLLNAIIVLYSSYRLYPLLQGETLPWWRILLSGALVVFCGWTLIAHFTSKNEKAA